MKFHWYLFLILFLRDLRYSCSQNNAKIEFLASRQDRKILFDKNQRRRISCTRAFKFRGLRKMPFLPCPSRVKSKSDNMVFEDKFKHIADSASAEYCSTFQCVSSVRPCVVTGVTSQFFTFITCPRPYKPYIF